VPGLKQSDAVMASEEPKSTRQRLISSRYLAPDGESLIWRNVAWVYYPLQQSNLAVPENN
jgi:hypothetical protein